MNCAYCASLLEDGARRCDACGARRPAVKSPVVDAVLKPRVRGGRPFSSFIWIAVAISLVFAAAMWASGDEPPDIVAAPAALWVLIGLPLFLLIGALRTGLRRGGRLWSKLGLALGTFAGCFLLVILTFA